jgi:hypothetical protein
MRSGEFTCTCHLVIFEKIGHGGHEIGDAGPVLGDADRRAAGDARVAVGHVRRVLLVGHAHQPDAGAGKEVERVHVGRADDSEHVLHLVRHERFDERLRRRHAHLAADGGLGGGGGEVFRFGHEVHKISLGTRRLAAYDLFAPYGRGESTAGPAIIRKCSVPASAFIS